MPTLDVTIGGATANSYASEADATAYFDERLNVGAWTNAVSDDRARALISATRWIDTQGFRGVKASLDQALQWPRLDVPDPDSRVEMDFPEDEIPVGVKQATYEVALALLVAGATDLWTPDASAGVKRKKVDVLETEYFGAESPKPVGLEKVPQAIRLLAPFLSGAASGGLSVVRV